MHLGRDRRQLVVNVAFQRAVIPQALVMPALGRVYNCAVRALLTVACAWLMVAQVGDFRGLRAERVCIPVSQVPVTLRHRRCLQSRNGHILLLLVDIM